MLHLDLDDALLEEGELNFLIEQCKDSIATLPASSCNMVDVLNLYYYEILRDTIKYRQSPLLKELGVSHWLISKSR